MRRNRGEVVIVGDGAEDALQVLQGQYRRSSTAKINGVNSLILKQIRLLSDFIDHRGYEICRKITIFVAFYGVKIAIAAFALTKRDMYIKT
jgi:hypothetical protein